MTRIHQLFLHSLHCQLPQGGLAEMDGVYAFYACQAQRLGWKCPGKQLAWSLALGFSYLRSALAIFGVSKSHLGFALQFCHCIAWAVCKHAGGRVFFEVR